jgi:nucleotide-binding universal stress UspA family protein
MQIVARAALRQFSTRMGNTELLHSLQHEAIKRSNSAKAAYDDFIRRHEGVAASWLAIEGEAVRSTIAEARYSDLVVLGRVPGDSEFSTDAVADILVGCGRPVLLVPDMPLDTIGSTVAIAWKDSAEAARAVTAAMPMLTRASRIVVISVIEDGSDATQGIEPAERLAKQLKQHGLPAKAHWVVSGGRPVEHAMLQTARESGADLIVMGAYSHSRFRELVFGGFTRHVLQGCDLPVLLLH